MTLPLESAENDVKIKKVYKANFKVPRLENLSMLSRYYSYKEELE